MSIKNAIASVAVKDLSAAQAWYERVIGRAPDSTPMPEIAEWKFERGGWLQVYELPERAGACSLTFAIDDVDAQIKKLDALKIDTSTRTSSAKVKTVMITDLDGNHIAFAQAIDETMAR